MIPAVGSGRSISRDRTTVDVKQWIEEHFQKCECMQFMQAGNDSNKCGCGREKSAHDPMLQYPVGGWSFKRHTVSFPTDAYGTLEFSTGVKAQYIRLTPAAKPEDVVQLFTELWGAEPPKLLISIQGGMSNFDMSPRMKRCFRRSLQRMAAVPGVWLITAGLNVGIVKHVGDSLTAGVIRRNRAVVIGITPFGALANRHRLISRNGDVQYYPPATAPGMAVLNQNHSFHLLVDDGTSGKYGAEAKWRRSFETALSTRPNPIPLVSLLVEGGANCITLSLDYVTDSTPVVVCDGSGRAADILALALRASEGVAADIGFSAIASTNPSVVFGENEHLVVAAVHQAFGIPPIRQKSVLSELILCTKRRELISVFQLGEDDIDLAVLSALLRAQSSSAPEQLRLALAWNRPDLATSHIFTEGQHWPEGALADTIMEALAMDRVEFVKILLDHGVNMLEVLTPRRLEQLYNVKHPNTWLLRHIARVILNRSYHTQLSLSDVGSLMDALMGYGYQSSYRGYGRTGQRKKSTWAHGQEEAMDLLPTSSTFVVEGVARYRYPFSELLVWAVLMRRQGMAKLMWRLGDEAMAKALVACRLYRSMANFLAADITTELFTQLKENAQEFADLAVELLDRCHHLDEVMAQQVLTYELRNFSDKTCLSLAVSAQHKAFVAHPCCQELLQALWMGGLRSRSSRPWKILLGIFFPPYAIFGLEYLTQEELRLQPQTEQELIEQRLQAEADILNEDGGSSPPNGMSAEDAVATSGFGISARFSKWYYGRDASSGPPADVDSGYRHHHQSGNSPIYSSAVPSHPSNLLGRPLAQISELSSQAQLRAPLPQVSSTASMASPLPASRYSVMQADLEGEAGRKLSGKIRFSEFFNAPVCKFWIHTLGYLLFIALYAFTILTRVVPNSINWPEAWIIAYVVTLFFDKIREVSSIDAVGLRARLEIFFGDLWNIFDAIAIAIFLVGVSFRWAPYMFEASRALYMVGVVFFLIHIFDIFQANEDLAIYITILHKMLKRMISFIVILSVVVVTYGIILQASRYPYRKPEWAILKDIFIEPYFNLYGEVYHEYIDTGKCSQDPDTVDPDSPPCWCCGWIGPVAQTIYLIIGNILMLNLLIAVFNNVFEKVNRVSQTLTKFQRYRLIVDYQMLPVLPPPFILFCHIYAAIRAIVRMCRRRGSTIRLRDPGLLKIVLPDSDVDRLHDFEEQARDEAIEMKEAGTKMSTDELVRSTAERTEATLLAVEQLVHRQNNISTLLQQIELRLAGSTGPTTPIPLVKTLSRTLHGGDGVGGTLSVPGNATVIEKPAEVSETEKTESTELLSTPRRPSKASEAEPTTPLSTSVDNVGALGRLGSGFASAFGPTPRRVTAAAHAGISPAQALEDSSTKAIGPNLYRRLRQLSVSGDDSEYSRSVRDVVRERTDVFVEDSDVDEFEEQQRAPARLQSLPPTPSKLAPVATSDSTSSPSYMGVRSRAVTLPVKPPEVSDTDSIKGVQL